MLATRTRRRAAALLATGVLLGACGGDDPDTTTDTTGDTAGDEQSMDEGSMDEESMTEESTTEESMTEESTTESMDESSMTEEDAAGAEGELAGITATAPDGSTFTLGDFAGQPVLVETFATWCSNCRQQLGDTQEAAVEAGEDAVFLALSVESDLDPASLTGYADDNGFADVTFGVLDDDSLLALQERFGGAVLTPPSTPKFRVAPDGAVSELTTGFETADEIIASLDAA